MAAKNDNSIYCNSSQNEDNIPQNSDQNILKQVNRNIN